MTTLKQCIAAWQALRAIATQAMDYKSAHALVLLMGAPAASCGLFQLDGDGAGEEIRGAGR